MRDETSARQVRVAVFTALLAPMAGLPALTARAGGAAGWLAPLLAIPAAVGLAALFRRLGAEGLGRRLTELWGGGGRAVAGLYYLWVLALAALTLRSCVDRLGATDYGTLSPWAMSLALTVVVWYLTRRGQGAFLRAAEIFYLIFLVLLALFFVLGAWNLRWENLKWTGPGDLVGAVRGLWPMVGVLSVGVLGAILPREPPEGGLVLRGPVLWCGAAAGVCLLVTGAMGAGLAGELPLPLFLALQGIGVPGGFQRLEALGTAVWVLSDLVLAGLAVVAGERLAGRSWGRWPVLAAAAVGGSWPLVATGWAQGMLGLSVIFGVVIPLCLWLTGGRRRKNGGGNHISCGGKGNTTT